MNIYKIDLPKIEIPKIDLPDFYIPKIEIPKIDLPDFYIPKIEIPKIDLPDFYIPKIEIPDGLTYTTTLDEDLSKPISFRSIGDGITKLTITSGESAVLNNSKVNNNVGLYVDDEPEFLFQEQAESTVFSSGGVSGENSLQSSFNHETSTLANLSDPFFELQHWHLLNPSSTGIWGINALDVWQDYTGKGVSVSVIDSGVDPNHPDLQDNYDYVNQFDGITGLQGQFTLENGETINFGAPQTGDAHGTAVAGLIGAKGNYVGVAYDSTIVPIYAGTEGIARLVFPSVIANSFAHAAQFDVSNNSWSFGNTFDDDPNTAFIDNFQNTEFAAAANELEQAVSNGRDGLGTIFVQTTGNTRQFGDDVNLHNFQNSRYNIIVGATSRFGQITNFSTPGAAVTVAAPGQDLFTTDLVGTDGYSSFGDYAFFTGTSGSAPIVSGVVALMLEANPNLGWRDVQEILFYSAVGSDDYITPSWQTNGANNWNGGGLTVSHDFGAGLVDAHGAVRLAETWQTQRTSANEEVVSVTSTDSSPLVIPDNDSTGISSIVIVDSGLDIDYVELELDINHNFIGDLEVTLTSPNGTVSKLVNRPGVGLLSDVGSNQDDIKFVFGSTQHWGETGAGEWTVTVKDLKTGDFGQLNNYTLRLYGDAIDGDDTYIYTDEFATVGNDITRQILNDETGVDTINAAAVTSDSVINLNSNSLSTIAGINIQIAAGTQIENIFAGDGNDTLTGNNSRNVLTGGRGDDILNGGSGQDTLIGGEGSDILRGQGGGDILTGGASNDVLVGGNSRDQFVFDSDHVFHNSDLGVDRILDFVVGDDQILLSKNTFTTLDYTFNGQLENSDFEVITSNINARGSSAKIVYNSDNGNLYYNENNAAAGFGNGGLFARLVGSPDELSARDFQVVDV